MPLVATGTGVRVGRWWRLSRRGGGRAHEGVTEPVAAVRSLDRWPAVTRDADDGCPPATATSLPPDRRVRDLNNHWSEPGPATTRATAGAMSPATAPTQLPVIT